MGIIADIGDKNSKLGSGILVKFPNVVFFPEEDIGKLTLAYAGTVHRAQGSEFPLCIVVCVKSHYIMLQRNLIYTANTRAKERLVLVCQPDAVEIAVKNDKIIERYSRLKERLMADRSN
ncbi:MAG: ATP-dependent RecD-like DNA helicase [Pelotomaculum sp. PtaU1.Bin065]|nr:MAG: ATP-dependent RecD-like DNA helicase [Pelotomaculum sp. PtaU1.Bin065]